MLVAGSVAPGRERLSRGRDGRIERGRIDRETAPKRVQVARILERHLRVRVRRQLEATADQVAAGLEVQTLSHAGRSAAAAA